MENIEYIKNTEKHLRLKKKLNMQKKIKYSVALLFSITIAAGMFYALYTDLNYFITKKAGTAEVLKMYETRGRKPMHIEFRYYNSFINETITCTLGVEQHDVMSLRQKYKQQNHVEIFYAANNPCGIYINGINAPRWPIIIFEVVMIVLMLFAGYSCFKNLFKD